MLDFNNKKVFVTGHTGFKGAWLIQLLNKLGAQVCGYSLPATEQSLYKLIDGDQLCQSIIEDIRHRETLTNAIINFQPDYIFHLAAQALVRQGYEDPVGTYETNVMGTLNVLEALRVYDKPCIAVMITTDKVYENPENGIPFKEDDPLGGYDPYSSSKACDEILIHSYRRSYFSEKDFPYHQKKIISVRAGNVIGGGDYAADRIIPDIVRATDAGKPVFLRFPKAVRPWQHVLEPLGAYVHLAALLNRNKQLSHAYNIGPDSDDVLSVEEVTELFIEYYGKGAYEIDSNDNRKRHEASLLMLDTQRLKKETNFSPKLNAREAIRWTAEWYANKEISALDKCTRQIEQYIDLQPALK